MKKSYLKKVNDEITKKIIARYFRLQEEGPIEALILQTLLVELFLRTEILVKLKGKKKKYFDKDDCKFVQLIDYYDILGGNDGMVLKLKEYNKKRNKIVHHALKFKSIENLENESREALDLGQEIIENL